MGLSGAQTGTRTQGGWLAMARNENSYERRLLEEPKLQYRPELLLLIPFFASLPLYQPNESVFARIVPQGSALAPGGMVGLTACLMAGLVLVCASLRHMDWQGPGRKMCAVAATLYGATQIACPAIIGTSLGPEGGTPLSNILAVVWGAAAAILTLAWARLFAMDFRNVAFWGALVCMGSSLMTGPLSQAPQEWVRALMPAMALLGSFSVAFLQPADAADSATSDHGAAYDGAGPARGPEVALASRVRDLLAVEWLPLLGLAICCFMMGIYELTVDDRLMKSECLGGILAAAIVIAACLAQRRTPLVIFLERLVIPLCAAVCILLQAFPQDSPLFLAGALSVYTPFILVALFALASGVLFAYSGEFPPALVVGGFIVVTSAATLLGKACSQMLPIQDVNLGEWSWVLACAYFAVVFAELAVFAWTNLVSAHEQDAEPSGEAHEDRPDDEVVWQARVSKIAGEHGLTARESEMLAYVSRGYGSTYISKKLFISPSTVRTHIKHVYAKLDVNSREELIALVERNK